MKIKNFAINCYGVFENGALVGTNNSFDAMIDLATKIADKGNEASIATLKFVVDTEVKPEVVIMRFVKHKDTVYITNAI